MGPLCESGGGIRSLWGRVSWARPFSRSVSRAFQRACQRARCVCVCVASLELSSLAFAHDEREELARAWREGCVGLVDGDARDEFDRVERFVACERFVAVLRRRAVLWR